MSWVGQVNKAQATIRFAISFHAMEAERWERAKGGFRKENQPVRGCRAIERQCGRRRETPCGVQQTELTA